MTPNQKAHIRRRIMADLPKQERGRPVLLFAILSGTLAVWIFATAACVEKFGGVQ